MVLDPIPQSLPVHFFGSRPQPPTSRIKSAYALHLLTSCVCGVSVICVCANKALLSGACRGWEIWLLAALCINILATLRAPSTAHHTIIISNVSPPSSLPLPPLASLSCAPRKGRQSHLNGAKGEVRKEFVYFDVREEDARFLCENVVRCSAFREMEWILSDAYTRACRLELTRCCNTFILHRTWG